MFEKIEILEADSIEGLIAHYNWLKKYLVKYNKECHEDDRVFIDTLSNHYEELTNYKENIEALAYKTPTDADMISSKKSSSSRNNSKDNTSKSKQSQMRQQSQEEKVTKQVESWNLDEVGGWLESLGFGQYVQVFKTNDITGSILLDLSLEDLDYMEIKILGHRKILLKSIEGYFFT